MALEGGFALEQPAGKLEEGGGVITSEDERRVDEGIGLDESTVEIDAERRKRCSRRAGTAGMVQRRSFLLSMAGLRFVRITKRTLPDDMQTSLC